MAVSIIDNKLLASSGLMDEPHFRRLMKFQTRRREALVGNELEIRTTTSYALVSEDKSNVGFTVYCMYIHRTSDNRRGDDDQWVLKKRYSELEAFRRLLFKRIEDWEYTVRREFARKTAVDRRKTFAVISNAMRRAISPSFPKKHIRSDKPAVIKERVVRLPNFVRRLLGVYTDLAVYKTNSQLQADGFATSWAQLCKIFSELETFLEIPQPQKDAELGLTPLLEAAEQMRPSTTETSPPLYGRSSPLKRELPLQQTLPSIMHAMGGYPLETSAMPKRARIGSDVGLDMQASYSLLGHMPRQAMIYPSSTPHLQQPAYHQQHVASYVPATETQSPGTAGSNSPGTRGLSTYSGASVWETVLASGKFPMDIGLSENGSTGGASPTAPFNPNNIRSASEDAADTIGIDATVELKQGRWSDDEKEYANALIQAVQRGEVLLPSNVSLRKFVADNLQCKTMRVSKKFRSLGVSPRGSPNREDEPITPRDESFNPLSLKSIMNNESTLSSTDVLDVAETIANSNLIRQSPTSNATTTKKKPAQRVLKRSDYSQHGMVRSGRWSVEEENYAKAMIEAFKAGYLPLHGNVSLRKFLSEVLVCHPMRISKKFVGYVRKYHWYRIAAGKCDPEAKRQALYQLSHLERVFWASLQQNSDWSAVVGVGGAALALTSSPDSARRLGNIAHTGVLVLHESEVVTSFEDAAALVTQWSEILSRGGLEAAQDELVERLLSRILHLQDDEQSQNTLSFLIDQRVLPLLVQYTAWSKPTDPTRLRQLVQSLVKLLEAAVDNGEVELWLSLVTVAQAIAHLMEQDDDVVGYVDLLQLGEALMKVQQLARQRLEEGADASRAFVVNRSDLAYPDPSRMAGSCTALVKMCSPVMPDSMKKYGLWALGALVQAVNREESSSPHVQQLEAALGPVFATIMLAIPRDNDSVDLHLLAATLVDRLLHVARHNPAAVTRETSGQIDLKEDDETTKRKQKLHLQLQLISARCLRTLTTSPQSRRYVCESSSTRAALFELSRQIHEKRQNIGDAVDEDTARSLMSIQRHVSWTFRNICTGFQSGAMALDCLFNAFWTASLLQSRRDLPMSRFFRVVNDLTDLPIIGAEEYEASTEFGWVDILTAWSASTDHQVRENAIASLVFLAEQDQQVSTNLSDEDEEIRNKQEHILQAWLTNMLQQIRLLSGGELLAVKQMEEIAHVSKDLTPGNERILFNPAVVDAGTSALAVLAEHHHAELVQQGVVPLVALLSATSAATPAQHTQCARVLANLNLRAYDEVVATGRLVKDVYCEGVHPIVSKSDIESREQPTDDDALVDVVFVHGLRGHPFGTWRTDMSNKLEGNNDIWPDVLLGKDLQRNNVPARLVTLGYEAGMVSWSSPWPSLTLQERARVMLSALYAANIGRDRRHPGAPARPVVFITHSMGGLLTKKMLLLEREQRDQSGLADSTTGVVFLAVPHFGSDLVKGVRSESIRKLIQAHPAIEDLAVDPNGRLKGLNHNFKQLGIDCFSVGEERAAPVALGLSAVVVKPDSADPGFGRFYRVSKINYQEALHTQAQRDIDDLLDNIHKRLVFFRSYLEDHTAAAASNSRIREPADQLELLTLFKHDARKFDTVLTADELELLERTFAFVAGCCNNIMNFEPQLRMMPLPEWFVAPYERTKQQLKWQRAAVTIIEMNVEFHGELDVLMDRLRFTRSGASIHSWGSQQAVYCAQLWKRMRLSLAMDAQTLNGELDGEQELSLLGALLAFEAKKRSTSYAAQDLEMLQTALVNVEEIYQHMMPSFRTMESRSMLALPPWFVPPYEVLFNELDAFSRGAFGSIHFGKWMNVDVVVKKMLSPEEPGVVIPLRSQRGANLNPKEPAEDQYKRFLTEMSVWSTLKHPNVLKLLGASHVGQHQFFVCEYATQGTIDSFVALKSDKDRGACARRMLHDAALGLHYLHTQNIVHADLRCNNILVDAQGVVKLTDFGFSSLKRSNGFIGELAGVRYRWVAPECLSGERPTFASNVYSFAMCAIEVVSGELPWGSDMTNAVVCSKVRKGLKDACRAFSWTDQDGGTCWLKNRKDGTILKKAKSGKRSRSVTPYACCSKCMAKSGCNAFSWLSYKNGMCWLKSQDRC
ncbi:hypothetical protein JG687_00009734 [Phytophthora cactorum]|uniref:Alpha/Beta hydrolase fold n=1 Tax=Phytophthora cactorum TaxID=29920 RepID=A0A8T1UBV7_9STRA|nr:hypothetical protein JG687_00009734 [Phytophthora cactorum]